MMVLHNPLKFKVFQKNSLPAILWFMRKKDKKSSGLNLEASAVAQPNPATALGTLGALDKIIPKYCTTIQVGVLTNNQVMLSLLYQEPGGMPILIEKIMIDIAHAKQLHEVMKDALDKVAADENKP